MRKIFFAVLFLSSLAAWGQSGPIVDQNTNAWGGASGANSGTALSFPDIRGTMSNQVEVKANGTAAASQTVTAVGCMRGGTCTSTLTSSTTVGSYLLPISGGPYDFYKITVSWTGGDATTAFTVNRSGTVARSPLCPGNAFTTAGSNAAAIAAPANGTTKVYGFLLSCTVTTSTLQYSIQTTADNTGNLYDVGIYDNNGNLIVHSGPTAGTTFAPNTAQPKSIAWTSTATLQPGRYYFAETCNTCVATLGGGNFPTFSSAGAGPAPSGNALVSGAMPADSWTTALIPMLGLR